ncbi:hypothetical protein D3C84_919260 [compost metagenome]
MRVQISGEYFPTQLVASLLQVGLHVVIPQPLETLCEGFTQQLFVTGDDRITQFVEFTGFPGGALHTTGAWTADSVIGFQHRMRPACQHLWVRQQAGQEPGVFQPLPCAGPLMRQHCVGSIADQPDAAVYVTWQLFEFMQSPKGG